MPRQACGQSRSDSVRRILKENPSDSDSNDLKRTWARRPRCRAQRGCLKDEVAVLGSPPLMVRTVSVDVKQQ